ncbi:uncharacterized protein LOC127083239 isoform X2 [Lathyrus oleraceus]|uniref:Uncharacterized protein n=1 Tax=Pisum sativum TaxID=3888 RepID=A0A9D5AG35_PEA|nr:uncharacterized protein LOC127083239 isoform X1 [Pisum sativum]XP_050879488.1 uncharacterized protein LOC127083239 isoform X2 [Pisum sativum]KAI5406536.1 hypothetical protein KIW84_053031 [Pisum sativum]KAI5406537.1 hypothetical protein KIW84_053031 [Pisum sativum]KAI5406538.1 hypothetical protein KIW84_053031 [Pisum sativum]
MTLFSSLQITTTVSLHSFNPSSTIFHKSFLPCFATLPSLSLNRFVFSTQKSRTTTTTTTRASFHENPVLWVGRICVFYALLKTGLVGSPSNPFLSDLEIGSNGDSNDSGDLGFSKWTQSLLGKPAKEEANGGNLTSKWHPTTKGTLRRNYRVPSKSEGRRLLKAIASLLSDDDHFVDATSHKGCQIRRESAHGESVCCNNVRALFDELPTPHLIVEITPFPVGPLSDKDYTKAEKLEKVLRSSPSV